MSPIRESIIEQIDGYCEHAGISTREFSCRVLDDPKFYRLLRTGKNVTLNRVETVLDFIASKPADN